MNRSGCLWAMVGAVVGFLILLLALRLIQTTTPPAVEPPAAVAPDVTVFLSEQSLSRMASDRLGQPTVLDFDVNGQMRVTTRTPFRGLEPVVQTVMSIGMQGSEIVSQLHGVEIGFLTIPATWLPEEMQSATTLIGETIKTQTPPDFTITGLTTTPDGVTIQLKWVEE